MKELSINDLPIESITVMARDKFEECSDALFVIEKNWKPLEQFGKLLIAARLKVRHGEWGNWVTDTFAGRLSLRTVQRLIADEKHPEKADERKLKDRDRKAQDPALLTGRVEVVEPEQSAVEPDDDPTPNPPTQRKTAAGSEKVSEDQKPRTQQVVAEIVEYEPEFSSQSEDPFAYATAAECIRIQEAKVPPDDPEAAKEFAKLCRKTADNWDPPDESPRPEAVPTIAKLIRAIDPVMGEIQEELERWARHKQSLKGKSRIQTMEAWRTMQEQMTQAAMRLSWSEVAQSILSSIGNNYVGWDIEIKKSGGNGNGQRTTSTGQSHSRPPVERAKYNYK